MIHLYIQQYFKTWLLDLPKNSEGNSHKQPIREITNSHSGGSLEEIELRSEEVESLTLPSPILSLYQHFLAPRFSL